MLASTIQLASVQNFYGEAMDNELYSLIGREAKYGAKHGKKLSDTRWTITFHVP